MVNMTIVRLNDLSDHTRKRIFADPDLVYDHYPLRGALSDEFMSWLEETGIKMNVLVMSLRGFRPPITPKQFKQYILKRSFMMLYFEFESEEDLMLFKLSW